MNEGYVVAEVNKGKRQNVKLGNNIFQSFYNIIAFTATSREEWSAFFEKGLGACFNLGAFIGLVIFKAGLYAYDLIVSKNKNLGKVISFIREFISMVILLLAAFGGLAASATFAAITPWLYIASFILNIIYNLSVTIQNAYHWATSNNDEIRNKYKESFKKHLFGLLFVSLLAGTFVFISLKVALPVMAIVSACLNAVSFVLGVHAAYKLYHAKPVISSSIPTNQSVANQKKRLNLNNTKFDDNYYYHFKNRAEAVLAQDHPGQYLLQQINEKIDLLQAQVYLDRNKFFSEETKRLVKMAVLQELKSLVENQKSKEDFYALLKNPEFNHFFNNPFQSFLRLKGDTQDIFEAAELYFNQLQLVPDHAKYTATGFS